MTEWQEVRLGQVANVLVGFAFKSEQFTEAEDGFRLLRGVNINQGTINWSRGVRWPKALVGGYARYELAAGDVVLAMDRPWIDAGLKRARLRQCDLPALLVQRVARIRGTESATTSFLHYVLASREFADYIKPIVTGVTVPHISQNQIDSFRFRLPSIICQERIGEILEALDNLIENNLRRIELLDEMVRAIYEEWFVRFRYPGDENDRLVNSQLGPIPHCWQVCPLSDLAAKSRNSITSGPFGSKLGRKDYVAAGVPVIRGINLRVGGGFNIRDAVYVTEVKADELRSSLAFPGDIIVTQRGTLGQVGLIPRTVRTSSRFVLSQSQMKISVDAEVTSTEFLYAQLRSAKTTERFVAQAMSSGVPHVNLALLREFPVVVPPVALANRFGKISSIMHQQVDNLTDQTLRLEQIRDLVLPKLITGQINVAELDLDAVLEGAVG